jgi:hypothetical protein
MVDEKNDKWVKAAETLNSEYSRLHDVHRQYLRLVTGGNAGGVVASLSVIGSALGASSGAPIPSTPIHILVIFLVGLAGSLFATVADVETVKSRVAYLQEIFEHARENRTYLGQVALHSKSWSVGASIAATALTVGVVWGVSQLYSLTG